MALPLRWHLAGKCPIYTMVTRGKVSTLGDKSKPKIMKRFLLMIALAGSTVNTNAQATSSQLKPLNMKLNAGIITHKLAETKAFYTEKLGFGVTFENDFYLLMHTPNHEAELSFLLPHHPSQQPLFHPPFQGQGMYLTIEVEEVDAVYEELKSKGVVIIIELRDEVWGDRHFAIQDPNGIGIDIVKYSPRE
jgi:catechol 2,3-dioxygenase-like lactoylglutathione lyase family enzyme